MRSPTDQPRTQRPPRAGVVVWRAILFTLLGATPGCGDETSEPIVQASDTGVDASCPAAVCVPYACGRRHCLTECKGTSDCATGFVCDRGFCVGTECTVETAAARCGGYACVGGNCSRDCTTAPCTEGFYCRGDNKHCVRKCAAREDPTCGGYLCDVSVGECEPYCFAGELGCAAGYTCTSSMLCE